MSNALSQRRVADMLQGVRQPESQWPYVEHVVRVYGFMTLAQIQKLVGETIGGETADCASMHELTGLPTGACRKHFRSNRCNHQLETSSNHVTAGGIYYASVAAMDTIPHAAVDAAGNPVTRTRIVGNTRRLYELDSPAYLAYTPFSAPDAPDLPRRLVQLHPALRSATTAADIGRVLDRLKDPAGEDMDLIKAALERAFAELLGPLPREERLP